MEISEEEAITLFYNFKVVILMFVVWIILHTDMFAQKVLIPVLGTDSVSGGKMSNSAIVATGIMSCFALVLIGVGTEYGVL